MNTASPTVARTVILVLSLAMATEINRRRTDGESIKDRIKDEKWPLGAQAHIGNTVHEGDEVPAVITRVWSPVCVNLKAMLDGTDTYWATSVNLDDTGGLVAGAWHWPEREAAVAVLDETPITQENRQPQIGPDGFAVYKCHKFVRAARIVAVDPHGEIELEGADTESNLPRIAVSREFLDKHNPKPGGFLVRYDNDYLSFSPAGPFLLGYTAI